MWIRPGDSAFVASHGICGGQEKQRAYVILLNALQHLTFVFSKYASHERVGVCEHEGLVHKGDSARSNRNLKKLSIGKGSTAAVCQNFPVIEGWIPNAYDFKFGHLRTL